MEKNVSIHFRLSRKLKDKIIKESKKSHLTMSEYICRQLNNKSIVVIEEGKNIYFELNKIGTNLNQIAKKINSGIATRYDIDELYKISEEVDEIWQLLNSLMSK